MLPLDTKRVWDFLKSQQALAGFVLVGGSALALRIGHRLSEDLDLVWPERRLPRARLAALGRAAAEAGLIFQVTEDEATVQEFADAGLDLSDYQQNYTVDTKVRVSFVAPEEPLIRVLRGAPEATVRIASLGELFKSKCLVSARRSKTRDWVDLYLLLRDHGFSLRDYREAFIEADIASQVDIGLSRLCSGVPQKDDEGYAHLLQNPPTLDTMKNFFTAQRDQLEIDEAADAMRQRKQTDPNP